MIFNALKFLPLFISKEITYEQYVSEIYRDYGIGQHLTSAALFCFIFIATSLYLENSLNITKSLNFFLSVGLLALNIGFYEIIYNILYSNLQNQPWTFSFAWRQGLNLSYFFLFAFAGVISIIYLLSFGYKLNFGKWTKIFFFLTVLTYILWIFYPFPTETLIVQTSTGMWRSSKLFPQTMYAVDIDPLDGVAVGVPFYVENYALHTVNVLNKLFYSLFLLFLTMVKPKDFKKF